MKQTQWITKGKTLVSCRIITIHTSTELFCRRTYRVRKYLMWEKELNSEKQKKTDIRVVYHCMIENIMKSYVST